MATEYLQFAGAMVLGVGILIGSYWFAYVSDRSNPERFDDRQRSGGVFGG